MRLNKLSGNVKLKEISLNNAELKCVKSPYDILAKAKHLVKVLILRGSL
jgi:hypothetical protein